ncbi:two pore domain potassium channel family protein [Vibrio cholerae]|uniref:ion channel n=1 Tax=Vibrio cholerae TaxID=666 RepID=UPI001183CF1A|nr:ion channel [Vibrio cholerae]TVN18994.1 two pore domain potassium channel family protein [Vibrio cholerae]
MILIRKVYQVLTHHLHKVTWSSLLGVVGVHYAICWVGFYLCGELELIKPVNFIRYMSVSGSTVGFGVLTPVTDPGSLFMAIYQLPVSLAIFGALLGKMINQTREIIERNMNGTSDFSNLKKHVIIIGYRGKETAELIKCIMSDKRRQNGQILLCVKDSPLTHPLSELADVSFVKVSSFSDANELHRIAANTANRVIIHAENDEQTLTASLSLSTAVNDQCHIVAYFDSPTNAELLDKHCKNVECGTNRTSSLLARSMQDPGSSRVISQLLNPQTGATQFSLQVPTLHSPVSTGQLSDRMRKMNKATLIAVSTLQSGDDVVLIPDDDHMIQSGHYIHYIAANRILVDEVNWQAA